MEDIEFYKMSGSGNDFIIIDNRSGVFSFSDIPLAVSKLCRRGLSVGADGLILLVETDDKGLDFAWEFYNADGSKASMCGNGARCATRLAYLLGISGRKIAFLTSVGKIEAEVKSEGRVKLGMESPTNIRLDQSLDVDGRKIRYHFATAGVPHVVIEVKGLGEDIEDIDVGGLGGKIRYHPDFSPEGTNVNFVSVGEDKIVKIRTYERGVEGETMACGTGAVTAAIIMYLKEKIRPPVFVLPKSGIAINVHFGTSGKKIKDVFLEGDARLIYRGKINNEAMD
jgi:diaminopimelate epimerase